MAKASGKRTALGTSTAWTRTHWPASLKGLARTRGTKKGIPVTYYYFPGIYITDLTDCTYNW